MVTPEEIQRIPLFATLTAAQCEQLSGVVADISLKAGKFDDSIKWHKKRAEMVPTTDLRADRSHRLDVIRIEADWPPVDLQEPIESSP